MNNSFTKQFLSIALTCLLIIIGAAPSQGAQQPAPTGQSAPAAPLSAQTLQQVTAPIAVYPDALVAQVLGAATFPDQVAAASNWLQQHSNLSGTALMQAVDAQPW